MSSGKLQASQDSVVQSVATANGTEEQVFHAVLRTSGVLANEGERVLRARELSLATYMVLRSLRSAGHTGRSASAIVDDMTARVPDVTRLVDRLENAGLVSRSRAESDRRIVLVCITTKGERVLAEVEPMLRSLFQRLLGHLDDSEMLTLTDLLSRVLRNGEDSLSGAK